MSPAGPALGAIPGNPSQRRGPFALCGICGIVDFSGAPVSPDSLDAMCQALAHRGPDDHDLWTGEGVGLGHRRLSILDLSPAGRQPMASQDGGVRVVYNGEIYNFRELRAQLESKGHRFVSRTDTEVIINGYLEWGQELWSRLDGMFALALWDDRQRALHLVRDPFGIKPLFYHQQGRRVVFASELKGILASGLCEPRLNPRSLSHFLTYFYTPGPATILEDCWLVPPARALRLSAQGRAESRYWSLPQARPLGVLSEEEVLERVRQECRLAVDKALVADVPIGLLLSAGIDSNIILQELLAVAYPDIQTFTVGFTEDSYDESATVKRVVAATGVKNVTALAEEQDLAGIFDHMTRHLDSLNANPANLGTYFIVQNAARHVKVALSGSGNDEIFAGYATYLADRLRAPYRLLPPPLRWLIRGLAQRWHPSGKKYGYDYLARKFSEGAELPPEKSHYWWRTIFTDQQKEQAIQGYQGSAFEVDSFEPYEERFREMDGHGFAERSMYADLLMFNNENGNMMLDNLSMAFSLEVRPPFLTKRFVEFAFQVPFGLKLKGRKTKYCLRKAYEKPMGHELAWAKKQGLLSPVGQMVRGQLREMSREAIGQAARLPFFNGRFLQRMWDDHLAGRRDYGYHVYNILTFMRWHDLHLKDGAGWRRLARPGGTPAAGQGVTGGRSQEEKPS